MPGSSPTWRALDWVASVDQPPKEAVAVLRDALQDDEPLVREHAA